MGKIWEKLTGQGGNLIAQQASVLSTTRIARPNHPMGYSIPYWCHARCIPKARLVGGEADSNGGVVVQHHAVRFGSAQLSSVRLSVAAQRRWAVRRFLSLCVVQVNSLYLNARGHTFYFYFLPLGREGAATWCWGASWVQKTARLPVLRGVEISETGVRHKAE